MLLLAYQELSVASTMDCKTPAQSSASESYSPRSNVDLINSRHCLVYRADTAFKPFYVSPNSAAILGVAAEEFVGNAGIWDKIIPEYDRKKVFDKFRKLNSSIETSFVHRIVNEFGVPTWVSHHVTAATDNGAPSLWGFIVPIGCNDLSRLLEPSTISSFIHKLGNHFQLLNLASNSIRKGGANADDVDAFQEALDKLVTMTRAFSEYSQEPAWVPAFDFLDVIDAAVKNSSPAFIDSEIEVQRDCDPRVAELSIAGDPYLLELAVRAVFDNAVEATNKSGQIKLQLTLHSPRGMPTGLKLLVSDNGNGIAATNLSKVMLPFFSTKANHIGLGLSMASRFVEMHSGSLKIKSSTENGTDVLILLPLKGNVQDACR